MQILRGLFFTFCAMLIFETLAQSPDPGQLLKKAAESKGLEKIRALTDVSFYYYSVNPALGIVYGKKALHISDSLNIQSEKGLIYNNLGANYLSLSEYDTAKACFNKALFYAQRFNDSTAMGNALARMGLVYEKRGIFDSCLIVFHEALIIFKKLRIDERIGKTLENIGNIHLHKGELKTALSFVVEAKECFEKAGTIKNLPSVYLKIGRIYSETGDYSNAEKWFEKGKQKSLELGDFNTAGIAINAIGIMFHNQGKYEVALQQYLQAIEFIKKIGNKSLLVALYGNIGNTYTALGENNNALIYHQKALKIAETIKDLVQTARQHVGIGDAYNSLKDYVHALQHLEKALLVFENSKSFSDMLLTIKALIEANNGLNKYERSVNYYEKFVSIKDSLNRNELNTALDSLKVKFNTEQTQQENVLLAQKTAIQEKTISLQRNMIVSSIVIAVLLVGFIVLIYRNRQKVKQTYTLLEEKNHEISTKAEELKNKNKKLIELSQFKDLMQSFLVHDLKNPLNQLLNMNSRESFEKNVDEIKQTGLQMLNIVSNLLDIGKYEENMMKPAFQDVSLTKVINRAFLHVRYLADKKSVRMVVGNSNDFIVKADPEILSRVFVNVFTNAVKFSPKGGKITISAETHGENFLKLTIKDEGEGIPAGFQPNIFDKFSQDKVRHLGYAGSTGIGLTFCKMAIESHGGKIGVQSVDGKGTAFWFSLPLASIQENHPAELYILESEVTKPTRLVLSNDEKEYLSPFCEVLKNTSIFQITDVKETLNRIDGKTGNIIKWKSLVMQALTECNEVKYFELL
jgi:signal transduction histidine kinase